MEGMTTRKVELRGIGFFSTFKMFFAITLIFSLVSYISISLFAMQMMMFVGEIMTNIRQFYVNLQTQFPSVFENQILVALISSVFGGVVVGVITAFSAAIFSFFAMLLGGVKIKIREKNLEKKSGYL